MVSEWRLRQGLAFVGGARVGVSVRCWYSPRGRQPGSEEGLSLSLEEGYVDYVLVISLLLWRMQMSHFLHSCFKRNIVWGGQWGNENNRYLKLGL